MQRQTGAALVTSLIFLVILTLLGMSSMGTALLENRMAGNSRDRNLAFQAAEMGLRDAEAFIQNSGRVKGNILIESSTAANDGEDGSACKYGFCYNNLSWNQSPDWIKNPVWTKSAFWANAIQYQRDDAKTINGVTYKGIGRAAEKIIVLPPYALPSALPLVSAQPEYLIESLPQKSGDNKYYYRITVRGYGMRGGTSVMLQEVYTPIT